MRHDIYSGWHSLSPVLEKKYGKQDWFNRIQTYLINRHDQIQQRLMTSFRYVECHPDNSTTFSYEYASLLSDIGSVFGSFLDNVIRLASPSTKGELNINNYCDFLCREVDDIEEICATINAEYDQRLLFPFHCIKKFNPHWWDAYNNVKHADIEKLQDGCLGNALYGFASLCVLKNLSVWTKFNAVLKIGVYRDLKVDNETLWRNYVFPIC